MELYEVMRTTFAAREFTDDPVDDATVAAILDHARFAPSGGNRQGFRVVVVRDPATKDALAALSGVAAKRYAAQVAAGENPWNTIDPPRVDAATIERTPPPARLTEPLRRAPVVLVVCVDLKVVASTDQDLPRVGIVSGASVYPFVWNVLLAARHEGLGGTITTLAVAQEPKIRELLGLPPHVAVCAVVPLGRPVKQLTRLRRRSVAEIAMRERWGGPPLAPPAGAGG
jgi:nitroreductase